MKTCCRCKKQLTLDCFRKNKTTKDGLAKTCKHCEKLYRDQNKEKLKQGQKLHYLKTKDRRKANMKAYYQNNKEKINAYRKQWAIDNAEKEKRYRQVSAKRSRTKKAEYIKQRCKIDPLFKLKVESRLLLRRAVIEDMQYAQERLKNEFKVDYKEIKSTLQQLFDTGMSWENHGDWHIDHIVPLFSAKNKQEVLELLQPKNLQPLWKAANLKKGKN